MEPAGRSGEAEETAADLEAWREQIDALDRQIVALLNRRAELARQIGWSKRNQGEAVFIPEREEAVLRNVLAANCGPLTTAHLRAIYGEVLSASRALQRRLRVAYFGPAATFTHRAARVRFGSFAEYVPARSIDEVFARTETGEADYGVVPVENSTEGAVTHTLDLFVESPLKICSEVSLPIVHHLLSRAARLEEVQRVYSHWQALGQCRRWLAEHLPGRELVEAPSTAGAARQAAAEAGAAAIGTEEAAALYGLQALARQINDQTDNYTRFLVIGRQMSRPSGRDKTSVLFSVRDRPGALHQVLGVFARRQINLSRIESRPSKRKAWEYIFFVDLDGHPEVEPAASALAELEQECLLVKVLGAWPVEQAGEAAAGGVPPGWGTP